MAQDTMPNRCSVFQLFDTPFGETYPRLVSFWGRVFTVPPGCPLDTVPLVQCGAATAWGASTLAGDGRMSICVLEW